MQGPRGGWLRALLAVAPGRPSGASEAALGATKEVLGTTKEVLGII